MMLQTQFRLAVIAPVICLTAVLAAGSAAADNQKQKQKPKTREVKVQDITLTVPETWKQKPPANKLRLAQFDVPAPEGVNEETELVVYSFGGAGGGLKQNLPRWIGEFQSQGRRLEVTSGTSPQGDYVIADIQGTHIGPVFRRREKPLKDARLLSVILEVKGKGNYFLKMSGPKKTVDAAADDLRTAIGANAEKEKDVELD